MTSVRASMKPRPSTGKAAFGERFTRPSIQSNLGVGGHLRHSGLAQDRWSLESRIVLADIHNNRITGR